MKLRSNTALVFARLLALSLLPLAICAVSIASDVNAAPVNAAAPVKAAAPAKTVSPDKNAAPDKTTAPAKNVSTASVPKPAAAAKSYSGMVARQTTGWGIFDTKVCQGGIRIESQTGAILVAQPPDWTVYIFRKNQKKASKMSYQLYRTKNRYAVKLSQIRESPRTVKVAGINALMYSFDVGRPLDEMTSLGSLYRSQQKQQIVQRKEVTFAPSSPLVPKQAKEIWRSYFESPVIEEIPLTTTLYFVNGEKRASMDTKSYRRGTMTSADFTVPPGLSFTAQFMEMIYGKEMEGVADLLWE